MVVPASALPIQELRTTDGQVIAFVLSSEEFAKQQAELQALREQVATLQRQKNHYAAELTRVLLTWMPVPPTEAELLAAVPNGEELTKLIADLESR